MIHKHDMLLVLVQEQSSGRLQRKNRRLILCLRAEDSNVRVAEARGMWPTARRNHLQLNMIQHVNSGCTSCDAVEWKDARINRGAKPIEDGVLSTDGTFPASRMADSMSKSWTLQQ